MKNQIICPKCEHKIDVEQALSEQIAKSFEQKFLNEKIELESNLSQEKESLRLKEEAFKQKSLDQEKAIQAELKKREAAISEKLKLELMEENSKEIDLYKKQIADQKQKNADLKSKELELMDLKLKMDEEKENIELTVKQKMSEARLELIQKAKKEQQEETQLKVQEKDVLIDNLKKQMDDMKRKMEQGSMQSQGEVQELALESLLASIFPYDVIDEVAKGTNGADAIQTVMNEFQQECGTIVYESKRTKSFSNQWIDKLKTDALLHKADIAVLVTETMPKGMTSFELINGVWVCSFSEIKSLSKVLRDSLLKINTIKVSQENKGDKMVMLYSYLTSNEFAGQIRTLVDSFSSMRDSLEKEKKAITKVWKEREKHIELVMQNTIHVHTSIRTIAGSSVKEIDSLDINNITLID
jgi:hypothetical protein